MLRHLNKNTANSNPIYRGGGSIAFTAFVRVSLLVAKHPRETYKFVLCIGKNNLGPPGRSIVYSIESASGGENIETSRIVWEEETELTAQDVVGEVKVKKIGKKKEKIQRNSIL